MKTKKRPNCCYLAAACLNAMGLSDKSLEMTAIKVLTEKHILQTSEGKRDFIRYTQIAPNLVRSIQKTQNPYETWAEVYGQFLEISRKVFDGRWFEAHNQYKLLIKGLEKEFVGEQYREA